MADARLAAAAVAALIVGIALGAYVIGGGSSTTVMTASVTVTQPKTVTLTETSVSTTVSTTTVTSTATKVATTTVRVEKTVEKLILVDALGRTVTLDKPVERLVTLAPSITEEVLMLNQSSKLVGVDSFSKKISGVPQDALDVGGYWSPSPEKILEAKPDLVLACSGVPAQERLARQLSDAGVAVFFTRCDRSRDWRDIEWDVEALGQLLGAQRQAKALVNWMEEKIAGLEAALANTTRPSVALLVYLQDKGAWVAGGGTFQDTVLSTAAATNVFHGLYGWQMVSYEDILAKNPDYLLATTMGGPDAANKTLERIASTPLAETRAWKEGHVCVAYGDLVNALSRPSPRAVLAAEAVASLLHPDAATWPQGLQGGWLCNKPSQG